MMSPTLLWMKLLKNGLILSFSGAAHLDYVAYGSGVRAAPAAAIKASRSCAAAEYAGWSAALRPYPCAIMADTQQQQPPGKCAACLQRIRNCCGWMRDFCGRWSVGMAPPSQGVRVTKLWQALLAELLGTMLFVLLGTGAWIETEPDRDRDPVRIAFTFGFSYAVLVYALRYISGGHLNPVISLCAAVIRRISPLRALLDVLVQCVGAILGSALLYAFTPNGQHDHLGATVPGENVSQDKSFAVEFFGTFVFVFVTVACWDKAKGEDTPTYINPFVIGITLIVAELYAVSLPRFGGWFTHICTRVPLSR